MRRRVLLALTASSVVLAGPRGAAGEALDAAAAQLVRAACKEEPGKVHRVPVPAPAVDWRDGALVVELGRAFSFEAGAIELARAGEPGAENEPALAPLPMAAEQGAAFVRARARDRLSAALSFELVAGGLVEAPCLSLAGGRILRARYRPVKLELFEAGSDKGRAAAVLLPPDAAEAARAQPRVQLGPIALSHRGEEPQRAAIEHSVGELEPALRRCYEEARGRRPELTGRIVLGVAVDRSRWTVARIELDSLGDAALTRCARAAVETLRPPATRVATFSLPIAFERR
jgi:hypothetical protein